MSTWQPPRDSADSAAVPRTLPVDGPGEPHPDTSTSRGRVAAVIPVFRAGFLAKALQSVMRQTRPPDEVIVVDDGSPDREAVAAAVAPFATRVTLIEQPNQGAAAARNRGMASTTAEYIALLDADDEWYPTFLEEQLATLSAHPDIDLVYSDGLITGHTALAGQRFMQSCPSTGPVTLESLLAQRCTVLLSGVVMRRRAALAVGGFDLGIRRGQDFDLWLRMAHHGSQLAYTSQVLVLRRIHGENLSGTSVNEQERPLRVLEKALTTMQLTPQQRHIAQERIRHLRFTLAREHGKEFLMKGDFARARQEFLNARADAFSWKISAALLGLRIAPNLMRRLYLMRAASLVSHLTPVRHLP
jgi:glycosyltransferase involved in cell wall biosynthesis